MKLNTVLIALLYGLTTLILLPLLFIWLNIQLSLPIYSFHLLKLFGIALMMCGVAIWLYSIALFYFSGKGTPVPTNPPKELVIKGSYKYTRNPMYVGKLVILLGYFCIFGHIFLLLNLVIVAIFFHFFITCYEEPILKNKFGNSYIEYCKKVPRWI